MRTVTELMTHWQFARLPQPVQTPLAAPPAFAEVSLPHVWNKDEPAEAGCCLYQTAFTASLAGGACAFLCFEAVAGVARVFLNGKFLGEHRGGYARFVLDVTDTLQEGENLLQVLADNTRYDDVSPLTGDFTYWGGIYRAVSLVQTGANHFDLVEHGTPGLVILSADGTGALHVSARVVAEAGARVAYRVSDAEGHAVSAASTDTTAPEMTLNVPQVHLWNGQADPYLYRCTAQLWLGETLCDEVSLPFGFRDVKITPDKGFFLNGQALRLNGVAMHQDFAGAGCAPTTAQIDQSFALIGEIGANAVRLSHYQHPQYTYDQCDRLGLVTWAEIPMLSMPEGNAAVVENAVQQLTELITQNRHHPAICFWGVQNEIAMMGENLGMYRDVKRLNAVVKELDPTRISGAANLYSVKNNSQLNFLTDSVGYNIYFGWYYGEMKDYVTFFQRFHAENPGVPLGVTEYGVDCNLAYHSAAPECKDYTEEFQCVFHENAYRAIREDERLWGSFVWNMFDFSSAIRNEGGVKAQNSKGLVTWDRQTRKDAFYYYKGCWSAEPFVRVTGSRFVNRCGEVTTVKVYSNQPAVTLYVNGAAFATQQADGNAPAFVFQNVPLVMGENAVRAVAGNCEDAITLCRVSEPDKSYDYPEKGKGNKVTNWFRQQDAAVDLFPEGRFSISDRMGELLADPRVEAVLDEMIPDIIHDERSRRMGGMTLMRILDYNPQILPETAMEINRRLNAIEK